MTRPYTPCTLAQPHRSREQAGHVLPPHGGRQPAQAACAAWAEKGCGSVWTLLSSSGSPKHRASDTLWPRRVRSQGGWYKARLTVAALPGGHDHLGALRQQELLPSLQAGRAISPAALCPGHEQVARALVPPPAPVQARMRRAGRPAGGVRVMHSGQHLPALSLSAQPGPEASPGCGAPEAPWRGPNAIVQQGPRLVVKYWARQSLARRLCAPAWGRVGQLSRT